MAPTVLRRLVLHYTAGQPRVVSLGALTDRETSVLRAVGTGLSNAEIAAGLGIGEATVKTHLNRAMVKLHISSRAQAVVIAYETGLVTPGAQTPR